MLINRRAGSPAIAVDGDKPLVDRRKCAACAYGHGTGEAHYCGFLYIKGYSRTSLHPEGLTSTCYEFEPKKRKKS